jgi:hypothetical protein
VALGKLVNAERNLKKQLKGDGESYHVPFRALVDKKEGEKDSERIKHARNPAHVWNQLGLESF